MSGSELIHRFYSCFWGEKQHMGSRWLWYSVMNGDTDTLEMASREKTKDLVVHQPVKANSGHNQSQHPELLALPAVKKSSLSHL